MRAPATSSGPAVRRISVVAPMRNEAEHVEAFVAGLAAQDFDGDVELLVADGGSTDGSARLLEEAGARAGVRLTLLANPARFVSQGLNACIRRAGGDLIVRVDCHSRYPPDYLRRCAEAAERTGAWNVGGVVVPEGRTAMERAVACAMDSPFGGIGWTQHGSQGAAEADTVTYGAFRPEAFRQAGLFDESLIRNQDDELNLRLRLAGGKIVLDPAIKTYYTPRGSFRGVARQYYEYGLWKPAVMLKHGRVLSARSLAPVLFVATLVVLGILSALSAWARWLLAAEVGLYALGAVAFAVVALRRRREPWSVLPRVVAVFPTFHVAYGLGMVAGWLRAARRR